MRNKLVFTTIILSNLLYANTLFAQQFCEDLFNSDARPQAEVQESVQSSIVKFNKKGIVQKISDKLSTLGSNYNIDNNKLYIKLESGLKKEIAEIKVIYPKYVFEYQDQSYHEYWVRNGVTKEDMDLIIKSPGQNFGRGYYVSLSSTDSQQFGRYLTTFRINKPLILLRLTTIDYQQAREIKENPEVIRLLKKAGLSGILCNSTWVSIFDESYLKSAAALDEDSLSYALHLNFDEELRRAILNETNANLTIVDHLTYPKNVNTGSLNVKVMLRMNVNNLTDNQKLILAYNMNRYAFVFAKRVLNSQHGKNALNLYATVLGFIKHKNYQFFRQTLIATQTIMRSFDLGFKEDELIKRVGFNE